MCVRESVGLWSRRNVVSGDEGGTAAPLATGSAGWVAAGRDATASWGGVPRVTSKAIPISNTPSTVNAATARDSDFIRRLRDGDYPLWKRRRRSVTGARRRSPPREE